MKIADLSRHRRVLLLCAGSAAVHLVLLAWFAARRDDPVAAPPDHVALSVRLLPAGAAPALPFTPPAPTSTSTPSGAAVATRHAPPDATRPRTASTQPTPLPETAARKTIATPSAMRPARNAPTTGARTASGAAPTVSGNPAKQETDAAAPATAVPTDNADTAGAAPTGAPLMQMPGRYRVRLPAPALLTYALTRTAPGGGAPVAAGAAQLDWRTDGDRYVLALDGALGTLHSEGASGDAGIVPRSARETRDGSDLVTEFAAERHRVLFHANGAEAPDNIGIQDRASVLMQLAGIGLGDADQVRDTVDVVVAGAMDARIARFQVIGIEAVTTGAGVLQAWHLAEAAPVGAARLEVWLAPANGWLPVQLRVTQADGASVTQTLARVAPGADLAAPQASR